MLCETAVEPPWEPPGWTNCKINMCYSIFNLMYMVLWQSHLQPDAKEYSFIIKIEDPRSSQAFEKNPWTNANLVIPSLSKDHPHVNCSQVPSAATGFTCCALFGRLCRFLLLQFHLIAQGLWQVDALSQGMTSTLPFRWTFQTCWGGAKLLAYQWNQMVTSYWNTLVAFCTSDGWLVAELVHQINSTSASFAWKRATDKPDIYTWLTYRHVTYRSYGLITKRLQDPKHVVPSMV